MINRHPTLRRIGAFVAVAGMLSGCNSAEPAVAETVGTVPMPLKPLVEALDDSDSMVRFQAMSGLGDHLSPELLPVIEPLLKDSDDYIRRYAVEYYARLKPV